MSNAWLYRWPNGDTSLVWASSRIRAAEILDEVDAASPAALIPIPEGAVHLQFTPELELEFQQFSERLRDRVYEKAYPVLLKATMESDTDEFSNLEKETIFAAEVARVADYRDEAKTAEGRRLAETLGMSGALADKWVEEDEQRLAEQLPPVDGEPS